MSSLPISLLALGVGVQPIMIKHMVPSLLQGPDTQPADRPACYAPQLEEFAVIALTPPAGQPSGQVHKQAGHGSYVVYLLCMQLDPFAAVNSFKS